MARSRSRAGRSASPTPARSPPARGRARGKPAKPAAGTAGKVNGKVNADDADVVADMAKGHRGRTADVAVLVALALAPAIAALLGLGSSREKDSIIASSVVSVLGLMATHRLIPVVARATLRKGLFGRDINKRGTPAGERPIPESLGLATGLVHIVCIVLFQQIHVYFFRDDGAASRGVGYGMDDWTEKWLIQYNAALASISLMLFLGFADDVLDIPWRTKLVLPCFATLPILAAYTGGTAILVPKPLRAPLTDALGLVDALPLPSLPFLGRGPLSEWIGGGVGGLRVLELGALYRVYMLLVCVFCTNSVNILAGINGLEAGQTLIIAASVLLFNVQRLAGIAALPDMSPEDVVSPHPSLPITPHTPHAPHTRTQC